MRAHTRNWIVCVGIGLLLLTGIESYAQTLAKHNWYFGTTQRSLRFNRVTNAPSLINNKAIPFGTGGSAVATDRGSGNLLFYTDGQRIYDANHSPMPNGLTLNGNISANQPVAICPVPGRPGKYFVFTNSANFNAGGTISYTIVDMNLFGSATFPSPPFGNVESLNTLLPGLANVSEGMITVPHANGRDFWLITQNVNSVTFNATLINAASYTGTFTHQTSNAAAAPTTVSHLAYHEILRKIAVAPQDQNTDAIILNFNETTGAINPDRIIFNSGILTTTPEAIYDVEWSPSGRFVYLSRHGEPGVTANVFQYDYQNSATTLAPILAAPVFRSYGLQRAPDSLIYHLYQSVAAGPFLLGRIESPDSVASKAQYNAAPGVFATLNFDGRQFPGFAPKDSIDIRLSFTTAGSCQNSPTIFFPNVRPGADSLQWDFGDGTFGSGWSPIHTYETSGSFGVGLTAFYQNQSESVNQPVTINAFALQIQLVQDTTACRSEFPPPRGSSSPTQFSVTAQIQGGTPSSIVWSNGDLGATLRPDSAGYYYVVVTDATGCSAYAGVNVKEYGLSTQTFNKWYFGDRAGIDFNFTPPKPLNESAMVAPEGCAIACDRNGQQLFYTDGSTVWDKTHAIIATDIGGNPASTQSSIVIPVPGDETLFYIFTTQAINGSDSLQLKYSLFDLKGNAGKGVILQKDVMLFMKSTERVTANGQWLIVHELGNSTFRAYPVSAAGIGNQVYSDIGSLNSLAIKENGEGYMKLGPRNNVAVPLSIPGVSNKIDFLHLNDSIGRMTRFRSIDLNEPNGSLYGVEFSATGNKLFASVRYSASSSAIYEYSIDSLNRPAFRQRIPIAAEVGAIQIGPDGTVYVALNSGGNNTNLGTIAVNEDTTAVSSFTLTGFALAAGTTSRLGLPNFIQNNSQAVGGPGITVTGLCAGDSTRFSAQARDQIDEFNWRVFRNGSFLSSTNEPSFALLLPGPGNYSVTLQLHNRCAPDTTMSRNFIINTPPLNPGRGVPICNTPTVTLDANPPDVAGLTYEWATGETTETLTVDDQGVYIVRVTDGNGCTTTGTFLTADSRPIFDLGPDITICEDDNTPALNVGNPGLTIQWQIDGVNASTTPTQSVDLTSPSDADGIRYSVRVTDPVTGCFRDEDKIFTIKVSPLFTLSGTNPTSCGTATGQIQLTLNPSIPAGGPFYTYFISGPGSVSGDGVDAVAGDVITIPNVAAGTYSAYVQDQISGCDNSQSFGLNDAGFTATAAVTGPNCDPPGVTLRITLAPNPVAPVFTPNPPGVSYTATRASDNTVVTGTGFSTAPFNTAPLGAGVYTIEVRDAGGCTFTFPQTITPDAPPDLTITPDLCALTLTASGANAGTYAWTANPPTALTGPLNTDEVTMVANSGTVTYTVTGNTGGCTGTETVTLNVGNIVTPSLSQSDECSINVTLLADPAGTFNYRWFTQPPGSPALAFDPTLGGRNLQLSLANNGTIYQVQLFEPQSGCTLTSPTLTASVQGVVDATLTSTPACADEKPYTLTAVTSAIGPTFSWSQDGTTLPTTTNTLQATSTDTKTITYTVVVSKANCRASATLPVTRAPLPQGALPNQAIVCDDPENEDPTTATFALDPGVFASYDWSKNGVRLNDNNRVFIADSKGTYTVLITDANQCSNTDETDVRNECTPFLFIPNAFKPGSTRFNNGPPTKQRPDLTNSDFWIYTRFVDDEQFHVFIFNRWGEMVFTSNDKEFKWNGSYNNDVGRPLPPGTYAYLIQYSSTFRPDEGIKEKRGGVALIR